MISRCTRARRATFGPGATLVNQSTWPLPCQRLVNTQDVSASSQRERPTAWVAMPLQDGLHSVVQPKNQWVAAACCAEGGTMIESC